MNIFALVGIAVISAGIIYGVGHLLGYLSGKGEACRNCPIKRGEPPWFR